AAEGLRTAVDQAEGRVAGRGTGNREQERGASATGAGRLADRDVVRRRRAGVDERAAGRATGHLRDAHAACAYVSHKGVRAGVGAVDGRQGPAADRAFGNRVDAGSTGELVRAAI